MKKGLLVFSKALFVLLAAIAAGELLSMLFLPFKAIKEVQIMVKFLFDACMALIPIGLYIRFFKKDGWELGFHHSHKLMQLGAGSLLGMAFMVSSVSLVLLLGGVEFRGLTSDFTLTGFMLLLAASLSVSMGEETLFRGAIQGLFKQAYGPWIGILCSSTIFFILHSGNPGMFNSFLPPLNLFFGGLILGMLREKTSSLWLPIGFHWTWNLCQELSGFSVSGFAAKHALLSMQLVPGKELLNGGSFGLEGSIVNLLLIFLICLFTAIHLRKKKTYSF
ncbi:hypothetical protein AC623_04070 [Bacillus sp. FJAT-27231]|uniref:CPBP family intramembrane glutamic endopeptidase n=1 Tax=Bacillus sp. FJAT-27231 TaxID=1679168 RepID=UPI000670E2A2|nr:type II CAAX endopeptidase family protein [Bacillus sp. FJAT-27231]KMY53266.1 hypothetical protein AC623_04070 [Bacillus sp. FJAT-27231]